MITQLFCCPICGEPLSATGGSYLCPARHTFDIARQGYVNLLTGRATHQHGDNKEMILARRDFLATGYYNCLMDEITALVCRYATQGCRVLDAGCGECTYTDRVERALQATGLTYEVLGMDISREALAIGCKRNAALALAVASLYHLPLRDATIDMILEIFAPHCNEEYQRVLRPGGKLLMVIPGPHHLYGLKQVLYEHPYENTVEDTAISGFTLIEHRHIDQTVTITSPQDLWNLFTMTPYFYRTSPEAKERLRQQSPLTTALAFEILIYEKQ